MKWISVKDRLPVLVNEDNSGWLLGFAIDSGIKYVEKVSFYDNGVWVDCEYDNVEVTHWMPLPKPPKED